MYRLGGAQLGDLEKAKPEIERAVSLAPDLREVRVAQGSLFDFQGDPAGALRVYEAGLRAAPNDVEFLTAAAGQKLALGRQDEGLQDLERSSRLDPRSPTLALQRYRAYFQLRRYDAAQAAMDQARSLMPIGISFIHEQAWLPAARGDLPGAHRALASAYQVADYT